MTQYIEIGLLAAIWINGLMGGHRGPKGDPGAPGPVGPMGMKGEPGCDHACAL